MARNGAGSYSLPSGNPVVSGTTISSTWANATLSDLANEMTDSLSRTGKGGMSGPFLAADGTVAAPGLGFVSDANCGFYHGGAGDMRVSIGGAQVAQWVSTGYYVTGISSASTAFRAPSGAVGTPGYGFTSDATTGFYLAAAGDVRAAVAGADILKLTAPGCEVTGTLQVSSTIASKKITATGTDTNSGGEFANGTAATGAVRQTALSVSNGDISLAGVVNPSDSTAVTNAVTPSNIIKAWAHVFTDGLGGVQLLAGFNIAAAALGGGGSYVALTLASPMLDQFSHAISAMSYSAGAPSPIEQYAGAINGAPFTDLRIYGVSFTVASPCGSSAINFSTSIRNVFVQVVGKQ